jgi:hypothetical protein
MKALRPNVALAIDGGGIRGALVARALDVVEKTENFSFSQRAQLLAGTSTGSIISAGLSAGLSAAQLHEIYGELAATIFPKTWRSRFWPLARYRYSNEPFIATLKKELGNKKMGDLWSESEQKDLVIVVRDLNENKACFVKPWKGKYRDWYIWEAVAASSTVPTYFPVFERKGKDYLDGGVGSYANPCYVAAFELAFCLKWDPEETTLISLGTGSTGSGTKPGKARGFRSWDWLGPLLDAFTLDAAQQQMHLVDHFFEKLDFRRFQVKMSESIAMDDVSDIPALNKYGEEMGQKILNDQWEEIEPLETVQGQPV